MQREGRIWFGLFVASFISSAVGVGCAASRADEDAESTSSGVSRSRDKAVLLVGNRPLVECERIEDACIFEGDIGLSPSMLVSADAKHDVTDEEDSVREVEVATGPERLLSSSGTAFKWPNGVVPYTVDARLSWTLRDKISQAIAHWQTRTPIRFVPRTGESSYVTFVPSAQGYAWASIGRQGGRQTVNLVDRNPVGVIVHELGHTLGFWHEHTRPDRDQYVTIHWGNIRAGFEGNFSVFWSGNRIGPYDIDSIMHYPSYEFSANGWATITRKNGTTYPANYTALSAGDIAAVERLYAPPAPGEILVDSNNDNNDRSKGYVEVTSDWFSSTLHSGYYGTGYWAAPTKSGPSDAAVFWFYLEEPASKTIEAWWTTAENRSAAAPWVMTAADDTEVATVTTDQRSRGSRWNVLGTWPFPAGWNRVELRRSTGEPSSYVIGDAVRVRDPEP